jgi:beta-lactamase regulating signal transducer with metallopeptidase domain
VNTILTLSAAGSALALLLLALRAVCKNKVSRTFSYYLWLLVLLRLALPLPSPFRFSAALPQAERTAAVSEAAPAQTGTAPAQALPAASGAKAEAPAAQAGPTFWQWLRENAVTVWALGAAASAGWYLAACLRFSRRLRRTREEPDEEDARVFDCERGGQSVRLIRSGLVPAPVLTGAFRPTVVLPQISYVKDGREDELRYILRHELVHARRRDILYKWAVVLVTSAHWFNPLMPLLRRAIGRDCELACDEAVIKGSERGRAARVRENPAGRGRRPAHGRGRDVRRRQAGAERTAEEHYELSKNDKGRAGSDGRAGAAADRLRRRSRRAERKRRRAGGQERTHCRDRPERRGVLRPDGCVFVGGILPPRQPPCPTAQARSRPGSQTARWTSIRRRTAALSAACRSRCWRSSPAWGTRPPAGWTAWISTAGRSAAISSGPSPRPGRTWGRGRRTSARRRTAAERGSWATPRPCTRARSRARSFASPAVGFMCYRYFYDQGPEIARTVDGGKTWTRLEIRLPDELKAYNLTPLVPAFNGENGSIPVEASAKDGGDAACTVQLTTADGGNELELGHVRPAGRRGRRTARQPPQCADGQLAFQIPADFPDPENLNIHIAGRAVSSDGFSQSLHFLEDVNAAKGWTAGKSYSFPFDANTMQVTITVFYRGAESVVSLPLHTPTVLFADESGKALVQSGNWYTLAKRTVLTVSCNPGADTLDVFYTPAGTDTASQQTLLKTVSVTDPASGEIRVTLDLTDSLHGYLEVGLRYGQTQTYSAAYCVQYEP